MTVKAAKAAKVETLRAVTRQRDAAVELAAHQLRKIHQLELVVARLRRQLEAAGKVTDEATVSGE